MIKTLWLDPGHGAYEKGGFDKGACAGGICEYKANLYTVFDLREEIKAGYCHCHHISLTRKKDVGEPLYKRMHLPKAGDFYISVHYNAFNRPAHGGELWVQSDLLHKFKHEFVDLNKRLKKVYEEQGYVWRGIKDASRWGTRGMYIERMKVPAILWEVGFLKWDFDKSDFDEQFGAVKGPELKEIIEGFAKSLYFSLLKKI